MKQAYVIVSWLILVILVPSTICGQVPNRIAEALKSKTNQRSEEAIPVFDLFDRRTQDEHRARRLQLLSSYTSLAMRQAETRRMLRLQPELIELNLPFEEQYLTVQLFREDPVAFDYTVTSSDGLVQRSSAVHYRGIIKGDNQSIAAISIFDEEVIGIISSTSFGNVIVGRSKAEADHIIYRERDLLVDNESELCEALEVPGRKQIVRPEELHGHQRSAAECVQVYFETSYSLFQNKGSVSAVENYVTGLFNGVATLYANEGISVEISQIHVWSSNDPFSHGSASAAIGSFIQMRPDFNGTVGHLLDLTGQLKGGLAYVDVLCDNTFNVGYSDINASYSSLPTYSWTINVVTHELGHNFGSQHTHDCVWGPQNCTAIDGCGAPKPSVGCGSCSGATIPPKGTIMSYCHVGGNGIDFNLGFGTEPGNLIRSRMAAASCLPQCGSGNGGGGCALFIDQVDVSNASCGENNGQIVVQVSGESGAVTYDIGHGQQSSNVFKNLAAGNYVVTAFNGAGCERAEVVTVQMLSEGPSLEATVTNATCGQTDGKVELTASGGVGPYSFQLDGKTQSNPVFENLGVGNYTALVIDNQGCSQVRPFGVFTDNPPSVSASINHTSCGSANGSITLSAMGGMSPYTYRIDNEMVPDGQLDDLEAGTYAVEVIDQNGCIDHQDIIVQGSEEVVASADAVGTQCGQENGSIKVHATGGTGTLFYSVGGSFRSVPEFSGLEAGIYDISVKDGSGCLITWQEEIAASETFDLMPQVQRTTCGLLNGAITVSASGETGPYQYRLNNAGNFTSNPVFKDLGAGDYLVVAQGVDGCIVTQEVEVENSSNPKPIPEIERTHCGLANGWVKVAVEGGSLPYAFKLDQHEQEDSLFSDLSVGTYQLRVTDSDGCVDSMQIRIDTSEAATAQISVTSTSCGMDNGLVSFEALSGVAPFAYSLNDSVSASPAFMEIAAGTYVVKMADADQCGWIDTIQVAASNAVLLESQVVPTTCGLDNGSIQFIASGGTGALSYRLLDTSFDEQSVFKNLPAGTYQMSVRDEEDCIVSENVEVLASSNPRLTYDVSHTRCGLENGKLVLQSQGGEAPFTYYMSGDTLPNSERADLSAGTYELVVVDRHGCTDSMVVAIETSTAPQISVETSSASCYQENGLIRVSGEMGIGPYSYSIGGSYQREEQFVNVDSGTYQVILKDQRDCFDTLAAIVEYDDQYQAPTLAPNSPICDDDPAVLDIGVQSPPNITWTRNGSVLDHNEPILVTDMAGSYQATINYHDDCVLSTNTILSNETKPTQTLVAEDTICLGETFRIAEANPSFSYQWSNDSLGTEVAFAKSAVYDLTVTNHQQCSIVKSLRLEVVQPISFQYEQDTAYICQGQVYQWNISGAEHYLWTTQDETISNSQIANPYVKPTTDQQYHLLGRNQCFEAALNLYLGIYQDVTMHVQDTTIIEGSPWKLYVDEHTSLAKWNTPFEMDCTECHSTLVRPTESGAVRVEYEDLNGCLWFDTIQVAVIPLSQVYPKLVNIITPNGDGKNDVLSFEGMDVFEKHQLQVFNQDGNPVYLSKDYQNNWSGTIQGAPLPEGVYYYILSLAMDDRIFQFDSDLTIVRD